MPISLPAARTGRIVYASSVTQVVWTTADGAEHYRSADRSVREAIPRELALRRKGQQRQHAPLHREHYSSTTQSHVWCESGAEELAMLVADRDPDVLAYRAQALEFVWPLGSPRSSHVVDRVDYLRGGGIRLTDVHRLDDPDFTEQAKLTAAACEQIGWDYQVFNGVPGAMAANLGFVAVDRHAWVVQGREDLLAEVVSAAAAPVVIDELCRRVRPDTPHIVLPVLYYALWHGLLSMTWSEPLRTIWTAVWRTPAGESPRVWRTPGYWCAFTDVTAR